MKRFLIIWSFAAGMFLSQADAQTWNSPEAVRYVERAIDARARQASLLLDYRAAASGWVLFLTQLGQDLSGPAELVKADQVALDVYWKAPSRMKQMIIGRRDRRLLPTDIEYHRDHLGIVQNNFGNLIRLGDGHEIRDVPHPLAPNGTQIYDFAVADSVITVLPGLRIHTVQIQIRPKNPGMPAILGSVWLDTDAGEVVRFEFTFTGVSYRDPTVEDITVVLDHGLWEGRFWLPRHQELEIRRRTPVIALPVRGIIRAEWDIDGYRFNLGLADSIFRGIRIAIGSSAQLDDYPWTEPLGDALRREIGARAASLESVRAAIGEAQEASLLSGLAPAQIGIGGISDLVHVNRVEGLALGVGGVMRPLNRLTVTGWLGYGFADRRWKGSARLALQTPSGAVTISADRKVEDLGPPDVVSRLVNSIGSQEFGIDYGDYYLSQKVVAKWETVGPKWRWAASFGRVETQSLSTAGIPVRGSYRPNPLLGTNSPLWMGEIEIGGDWTFDGGSFLDISFAGEAGWGRNGGYRRGEVWSHGEMPLDETSLSLDVRSGAGSSRMPAFRSFVMGGRGTLPGEPFRSFGGRAMAWGRLGWRVPVPFPSIGLGSFASTGKQIGVMPYFVWGQTWWHFPDQPWMASGGVRLGSGLMVELVQGLIGVDLGVSWMTKKWNLAVDVSRVLWPIL